MLILIGGRTASGKENLVKRLIERFGEDKFERIRLGMWSTARDESPARKKNLVAPDVRDAAVIQCYNPDNLVIDRDFINPNDGRKLKNLMALVKEFQKKKKNVIIEGTTGLTKKEFNDMADLKIWCEPDSSLCLLWRIKRSPWYTDMMGEPKKDSRNFGGSLARALESWERADFPSFENYCVPSKANADLVLNYANWEEFDKEYKRVAELVDLYFQDKQEFQKALEKERSQAQSKQNLSQEQTPNRELSGKSTNDKEKSYNNWMVGGICLAVGLTIGILLGYFWKKEKSSK